MDRACTVKINQYGRLASRNGRRVQTLPPPPHPPFARRNASSDSASPPRLPLLIGGGGAPVVASDEQGALLEVLFFTDRAQDTALVDLGCAAPAQPAAGRRSMRFCVRSSGCGGGGGDGALGNGGKDSGGLVQFSDCLLRPARCKAIDRAAACTRGARRNGHAGVTPPVRGKAMPKQG